MSYPTAGVATGVTAVDCEKQVRSWRLLLSVAELLIPTCNCIITTQENEEELTQPKTHTTPKYFLHKKPSAAASASTVTGTVFGYRRGNVSFCIQTNPKSASPILLLELAIPTKVLAIPMPSWTMYCNGRKAGFAVKRRPSMADVEVLRKIEHVVAGAGIASLEHDVMYLRGMFERFHGSANMESFHLIDPDGSKNGQELSFYFLRSR